MSDLLFSRLAQLGEELEATGKRLELTALVAGLLAELSPAEIPPAVRLIIGQVFPEWDGRTLNVSWKAVMAAVDALVDAPEQVRARAGAEAVDGGEFVRHLLEAARRRPPEPPPLTLLEVYAALAWIAAAAGPGSRARKDAALRALYARSTDVEAKFVTKILVQEMRHGVSEGIVLEAIARAAGVKPALVRQANQWLGDLGEVALTALTRGEAGLREASVRLFRPLKPMLAQTAEQMGEAFERFAGRLALEYKLDGARVQVHRQGDAVRIYSRGLGEVTNSLPDLVAEVRDRLAAEEAILDGEAIAVDGQGRPLPFQHVMRRFGRKHGIEDSAAEVPIHLELFDLLFVDGTPLAERPAQERWAALERAAGGLHRVRRLLPSTLDEGLAFAEEARRAGHEGVMAKDLDGAYSPGVRGKSWLKLKHVLSLDLVVIAADWGYGRRHGWLSNYHLAARDAASGEYRLVGKTFKGLTDAEFQAMTARLLALERGRSRSTAVVQPQVVVEVLFNEIQASPSYTSGLALRFARIARIRDDKSAAQADSLETVRELFERQFQAKGRPAEGEERG